MIDIVRVLDATIDLDDPRNNMHQVTLGERTMLYRDVQAQPAAQLVATHPAQVVTPGAEQQRLEIVASIVQGRRVPWAHPTVKF